MTPSVRYTETAAADLSGIAAEGEGVRLLSSVRLHCRQLARVTKMGQPSPELGAGVLRFLIGHHAIYFRRDGMGLTVLRVLHSGED